MKNFNFKRIISVSVTACCVILYVIYMAFTFAMKKNETWAVIGYSIIGVASCYVISIIFHELGHLIFGLAAKLKLCYFKVFCFKISKSLNGKISVCIDKTDVFSGETSFYPKTGKDVAKSIGVSALGGPAFSFIQTIVYLIISTVFMQNTAVYCIFGMPFVIPLYLFIINLIPFSERYDGAIALTMLSGGKRAITASSYVTASALVYDGETPSELSGRLLSVYDENYDFFSVKIIHLRYLSFLMNNESAAFAELDKISDKNKLPDGTYGEVIYELLFKALICGDEKYVSENRAETLDYLCTDDSPTSFRVQAALCIYDGDYNRAKMLIASGIKSCETYSVKGVAKLEKQMLEKFNQALSE